MHQIFKITFNRNKNLYSSLSRHSFIFQDRFRWFKVNFLISSSYLTPWLRIWSKSYGVFCSTCFFNVIRNRLSDEFLKERKINRSEIKNKITSQKLIVVESWHFLSFKNPTVLHVHSYLTSFDSSHKSRSINPVL